MTQLIGFITGGKHSKFRPLPPPVLSLPPLSPRMSPEAELVNLWLCASFATPGPTVSDDWSTLLSRKLTPERPVSLAFDVRLP